MWQRAWIYTSLAVLVDENEEFIRCRDVFWHSRISTELFYKIQDVSKETLFKSGAACQNVGIKSHRAILLVVYHLDEVYVIGKWRHSR